MAQEGPFNPFSFPLKCEGNKHVNVKMSAALLLLVNYFILTQKETAVYKETPNLGDIKVR